MGTRSRSRSLLLFFLLSFLLLSLTLATSDPDLDDAELSILQDSDSDSVSDSNSDSHHSGSEFDDEDEYENFDAEAYEREGNQEDQEQAPPQFDEKDVAVLTAANFTEFVGKNKHVMVEFYAPWCGHCQALAPEYAAAATELKDDDVALAKVDATEESELAQKYDVEGFPTVVFFVDGVNRPYGGARSKDALVTWIKKKIGPAVENITTTEEAEEILFSKTPLVLGFFKSLGDAKSQELAAASKLEDGVNFYQTDKPDVAKLFRINPKAKRPSLVLVKKEAEIVSHFDGEFTKSAIVDFVTANKLPLVSIFTKEKAPSIFENPIKKQLLLFATLKGSVNIMPNFMEAAKSFKGKIIFVYVEVDNGDFGKPVADYFGVTGQGPSVLAYTGNDDARKFMLGGELTLKSIKAFAQDFLEDKLKPFYKSDPVPESNDGDVKIVVGNNFDEIVLDESKDVLLEIYAPWCGHCQALEPIYNKLAKHLRSVESLVIAKMDGTTNEHPRAKPDGFPTLLFFPAGNKSFDPITVETDRTVVAFYKFLKKNAAIPFKLQKPASAEKSENAQNLEASSKSENSDSSSSKDEL